MSDPYAGLPVAPPPPEGWGEPRIGPRPSTVTNAVRLMFLQVAISLIGLIILFATKSDLKKRILKDSPSATDSTVTTALTVGAVVAVIFIVLYALLAVQVNKGRNWARIVTWVLAGLGILSGLVGLGQPAPTTSRITNVLGLVIAIGIVVLLAMRPSSDFFRRRPS